MSDAAEMACPRCDAPMETGRVAGAWGGSLSAATIDWVRLSGEGEEERVSLWRAGEELAPHPLTNFSASPRFEAARCPACRLVLFWY